jgi:putative FmdB family regulatory protein
MPLYAYQCKVCGHQMEHIRPLEDRDNTHSIDCPNCSGTGPEIERIEFPGAAIKPAPWF